MLVAAAVAAPHIAATQPSARVALERFAGRFENPLADDGASAIEQAIEAGIAEMHAMRRLIAERRLKENNPPISRMEFAVTGEGLMVGYADGRRHLTAALDTWTQSLTPDGSRVDVLHRFVGGRLVQALRERNGGAEHVFVLSPDGRELEMQATITSPHIPRPIRYAMTLERVN